MPRRRTWSDEDLAVAVERSENLFQVCGVLGVTAGSRTYEQLRRHIRRLGIDATHLPPAERPRRRRVGRAWTIDDLRAVVAESKTLSEVQRRLG